ncbi:MAG: class I SAM-dependent methyltransferase, partial [Gemmatimonadota bacterium]|nr:class I SAM-dependent methyltransferase [Gemmatimonadota bacterium]
MPRFDAAMEAAAPRFAFGRNWASFLRLLDEERIRAAEDSLRSLTGRDDLTGLRFLDIGSGSGLFSLAARRLGARVHSFDYDTDSVECTRELRRQYFAEDANWVVEQGSVLDPGYIASLGTHDVVYSWGVLHHTGAMWVAVAHALA